MKNLIKFLSFLALSSTFTFARAETIEAWHGWMNLTPCSKVEWNNNGIFGTPSPTYRDAPQELHGWIRVDVTTTTGDLVNAVRQVAMNCAGKGAAAAGTTALITGGPGSWEAFSGTFNSCISSSSVANYFIRFRLDTDTRCMW